MYPLNDCEDQFGPVEFSGYNIYQSAVLGFQPDKGNAEATSEYSVIEKNPKLKIDEVTFYSPYATEKPVAEVHFTNIGESYENHIFLWMDGQMKGGVGVYTDPGEKGEAWICISPPEKGKHPFTLTSDWDGKDVIYKGNVEITDAPKNNLEAEYTIEGISQEWKDGVLYNDIYKAFTIHMKITNKASTPYNSFIIGRVGQIGMLADRETYIGSERGIWKRVWYVQLAPNETMDFDMILDEAVFEEGDFGYSIFFSYCKETDYTNTLWGNGYFKYFAQSKNYLGDVDGDGIINITDAMVIVDYVLGKQPSKFIFANADLDKDGTVNITDAMLIVDYLLGKQ